MGEEFRGPHGESLIVGGVRLRTKAEFATALARYRRLQGCSLAFLRAHDREDHTSGTVTAVRTPSAFRRLGPEVHAFRQLWTDHGKRWNRDTLYVIDPGQRSLTRLFFRAPVGKLPLSVELNATKAALHAWQNG